MPPHRERREPVEVDDGILAAVVTLVALRPFADVAIEADCRQVASRHEIHVVAVRDEIREGKLARVGVMHKLAEADAEGADAGRHQDVAAAGCLRAALQHAPVHRTHLVGMVREIRARACVVEREHAADEQRALVVRSREGAAEGSARLAVAHVAVCEEEAVLGRKAVGYLTRFAHEAVLELCGICYA